MRFGLLGPLEVVDAAGHPVDVGGAQPRLVLALLLVAHGRAVSPDTLIGAIWGDAPPPSAATTLQSYVSRLRRAVEPDRPKGEPSRLLLWEPAGYRLAAGLDDIDSRTFERLADDGRVRLDAGDAAGAHAALVAAEALWRGRALGELADHELLVGVATRLEERRLGAIEDRLAAELALGRHGSAGAELAQLVGAHPLRERMQELLALALYRSGRQADALRVLNDAGRHLREELGLEPSPPLRALEARILAHDPALDRAPTGVVSIPADPLPAGAPPADAAPAGASSGHDGAPGAGRLVGRDHELGLLRRALAEAADAARFVVVEGEPGIGKTRLVDELRRHADALGALTVWGRTDEGGAAPALWPWLAPMRAIADRAVALGLQVPQTLAELLTGSAPVAAGQAESVRFERFDAVAGLLGAVSAREMVVVLLDDLQWADVASLDLLAFLAARLDAGSLVVGTVRQLEVGRNDHVTDALAAIARRPGSRRLHLRGLDGPATAAMLSGAHIAAGVPPAAADAIHRRAEGNPFYAIELARLLDEEGDPSAEVPATVRDVIRRRLGRLPEPTVELLGVAAVIGRDLDLVLLASATGRALDDVFTALEPALVHRLLVEAPDAAAGLRFSHALVREVLLDGLSSLRRARLHLTVADAIEARGASTDDVEILAEHLWRAAPVGVGRRAAVALERAADIAVRRVAYAAAETHLRNAAQLRRATSTSDADRDAELETVYRLLGVTRALRYFQGAPVDVIERGKELAARAGRTDRLLELLWFEFSAYATSSRIAEAAAAQRTLDAITRDVVDPEHRATAMQTRAVLSWLTGRISEACDLLDAVRAEVEGVPASDGFLAEMRLVCETFWIFNHSVGGRIEPADAFAAFQQMIDGAGDRFFVSSVCGFAATTATSLRAWSEVDRFAAIAFAADPGSQFAFWGGQALMHQAIALAWRGELDAAVERFEAGRNRYTGIGGRSAMSTFLASLAEHLARHGDIDRAQGYLREAWAEIEAHGERWNEPIVAIAAAAAAAESGDTALAAQLLERAERTALAQGAYRLASTATALRNEASAPA